jgi:hypothetical protein
MIGKCVGSEQFGVPSTARANIAHRYERLSFDRGCLRRRAHGKRSVEREAPFGVLELGVGTKDIERTIARPRVARDRGPYLYVVGAAAIC